MSEELVSLSVYDQVAEICLNRPDKRNAFSIPMYLDLASAIRQTRTREDVNVVLLKASGRDFCAGNDLVTFAEKPDWDPDQMADRTRTASTEIVHQLMECEKPIVAYVHGRAVGFGATMLLHCDAVLAEAGASLSFPFIDLALIPEAGATLLLPQLMGRFAAFDILTRSEPISAEEALRLKIVTRVVTAAEGGAEARRYADRLAAKPLEALMRTKQLMKGDPQPLAQRVSLEFRELARLLSAPAARTIFADLTRRT